MTTTKRTPASKRPPAKRTVAPKRRAAARGAPGGRLTIVPDQIAIRCRSGQEPAVQSALATFGKMEPQPAWDIVILHRTTGVPRRAVDAALDQLQHEKRVEFATPVLLDLESGLRQVLTDEIVVRLRPGRTATRTLAALKAEHDLKAARRNAFEPTQYIVKVRQSSGTRTLDVARSLDRRADVEFASPNFLTSIKR